jgi:hypothetical protein
MFMCTLPFARLTYSVPLQSRTARRGWLNARWRCSGGGGPWNQPALVEIGPGSRETAGAVDTPSRSPIGRLLDSLLEDGELSRLSRNVGNQAWPL